MAYDQAVYLALLQGLTEFLPISSSAHLILMPVLFGWRDQGLAFDIAVHVGTLSAVVAYYRRDLTTMLGDWLGSLSGGSVTDESRLTWYVIAGTIPVCIVGLMLNDSVEDVLRSPLVIAIATIAFGLVLWFAGKTAKEARGLVAMHWRDPVIIGACQALALIPGTSRSGITITAGLLLGFKRDMAARFSFLLSIPAILLPGMLKTVELIQSPDRVHWQAMLIGVLVSAVVAYLTIGCFLRLLDRIGLLPFVVYRLLLGGFLLFVFLV